MSLWVVLPSASKLYLEEEVGGVVDVGGRRKEEDFASFE